MEYDSVVVSSFRKFCKIFACLIIFRHIYDLNVEQEENDIRVVHGPNTTPVVHHPNLSQVRLSPSPCLLHSSKKD